MADFDLDKNSLPLWTGGTGTLKIHVTAPDPTQPLPVSNSDLIGVDFDVNGGQNFTFGTSGTAKLGIKAHVGDHLTPIWPQTQADTQASQADILKTYGLDQYFLPPANQGNVLLAFQLAASADLSASGSFTYSAITATATLAAGGDVSYAYIRPLPSNLSAEALLTGFFSTMGLPANLDRAPADGEVIAYEYGGYLNVGAGLSIGYQIKGSPSFNIGQFALSESYALSVLGKLSLAAQVAGRFSVQVSAARDAKGVLMPGWARVQINKSKSSSFSFAADVNVDASASPQGLPAKAEDFLGAVLGTKAKNWLNLLDTVRDVTDPASLKAKLDNLSQDFIEKWIGKGLDQLTAAAPEFVSYLGTLNKVVTDYQNLDQDAITLFDRYYNVATGKVDGALTAALNQIKGLGDWNGLTGGITGDLATVLGQLTGGNLLTSILGGDSALAQVKTKVDGVLSLIQDDAHSEIKSVIALANQEFGLDQLFTDLGQIDSVAKLQQLADTKAVAFAERIIGKAVDGLNQSDLGKALQTIQAVVKRWDTFSQDLYGKFQDALTQSFSFKLHSEYDRADDRTALVDVSLNMATAQGQGLMKQAGQGDFASILLDYDPAFVRLNQGVLTHNTSSGSTFQINIEGWHKSFIYSGFDKVIVNTQQQIRTDSRGVLTVYSTISLDDQQQRLHGLTGKEQSVFTDFTLRILGESSGQPKFDQKTQQYLINVISGYSAGYQLQFSSDQTTQQQLGDYLGYAQDFGLANSGATLSQVMPTLQQQGGNLGKISANYQAQYSGEAVQSLLKGGFNAQDVRDIMRKIVLSTYLHSVPGLVDVAWWYWSQDAYLVWKNLGFAQFINTIDNLAPAMRPSPFTSIQAPAETPQLDNVEARALSSLFEVEDGFVSALQNLSTAVAANPAQPQKVEDALKNLGSQLDNFNFFSMSVNSTFAVFDKLIGLTTPPSEARTSSLTLLSPATTVDASGKATNGQVTKVFVSVPAQIGAAARGPGGGD